MAIVKELKNLGKKMTGGDISGNIISETLKAIEQGYSGGSPETYETAFELNVGTMEPMTGTDVNLYGASVQVASVPTDSVLYFGSPDCPLTKYEYDGVTTYLCNLDISTGARPEPTKPGYVLRYQSEQDAYVCTVVATEDHLSNTTVRILKKVEQGGDAQSSEKAFDFTAAMGENHNLVVTPGEGVTWEAIKSALDETDNVFAHVKLPSDFIDSTMRLRFNNVAEDGTGASAAGLIQAASYVYAIGLTVINASGGETKCVGSVAQLATT